MTLKEQAELLARYYKEKYPFFDYEVGFNPETGLSVFVTCGDFQTSTPLSEDVYKMLESTTESMLHNIADYYSRNWQSLGGERNDD